MKPRSHRPAVQDRILVLDDDPDHVESIRRAFENYKDLFTLECLETVRQAKASIRLSTPSLAIIDWRLSDGSGVELLPGYERPAVFPVILLTSYGSTEAEEDVLSKGAVDYVEKDPESLRNLPDLCLHVIRFWKHLKRERELSAKVVDRAQRLSDLGMVAGGMVHDLNNKLAAMKRAGELALEDCLSCKIGHSTAQLLETVVSSAKTSQALTRRILENTAREHRTRVIDLGNCLDGISRALRSLISGSVELIWKLPKLTSPNVRVDPLELELVITNLVKNAEEAIGSRPGKVWITLDEVALPDTSIEAKVDPGHYLRVRLRDNGQGISKANLDHMFEPFFTTKPDGTGLGLARAKLFVDQCGGSINVQSRWNEGSEFSLLLPACSEPLSEASTQASLPFPLFGAGEQIVVVDDEESLLPGLAVRLERWNYRIQTFRDSLEALNYLRRHKDSVKVVLTDYLMPGLTGSDLRKRLLGEGGPLPKMILMTGRQDRMDREKARREGFDGFIEKPGDDLELSRLLRRLLDQSESHPLTGKNP